MLKTLALSAATALAFMNAAVGRPAGLHASQAGSEEVFNLPVGAGLTQRVLWDAPSDPRATLVMLPGGSGEMGIRKGGDLRHDDNFVVRTRADWVRRGYAVLIPDTLDQANLRGVRSSPAYGQLVDGLAAYAHSRVHAPVFLIGTGLPPSGDPGGMLVEHRLYRHV